jgi:hypothetical protein
MPYSMKVRSSDSCTAAKGTTAPCAIVAQTVLIPTVNVCDETILWSSAGRWADGGAAPVPLPLAPCRIALKL